MTVLLPVYALLWKMPGTWQNLNWFLSFFTINLTSIQKIFKLRNDVKQKSMRIFEKTVVFQRESDSTSHLIGHDVKASLGTVIWGLECCVIFSAVLQWSVGTFPPFFGQGWSGVSHTKADLKGRTFLSKKTIQKNPVSTTVAQAKLLYCTLRHNRVLNSFILIWGRLIDIFAEQHTQVFESCIYSIVCCFSIAPVEDMNLFASFRKTLTKQEVVSTEALSVCAEAQTPLDGGHGKAMKRCCSATLRIHGKDLIIFGSSDFHSGSRS